MFRQRRCRKILPSKGTYPLPNPLDRNVRECPEEIPNKISSSDEEKEEAYTVTGRRKVIAIPRKKPYD
jgi:hypothetical protein